MASPNINGFSIAYIAIGGIILYSGIKGTTLSTAFRDLTKGQVPDQNEEPITGATLTSGTTGSGTIAGDAMRYVGSKYVWGGIPGTVVGADNGTDCSGFVNMVIGRDLGMPIPGYPAGAYKGSVHGPASQQWLLWSGAVNIPKSQAQSGDLACWVTHIGIFTDSGHVISSFDSRSGVIVSPVAQAGPAGEPLIVRRLK